eukprot:scaffold17.g471.t1
MRDLRRGVTWGDSARLRRFTNKLLSGQPVSVGLLGSSVTAGQGAEFGGPYSRRFFQFVNTTFPHPGHVFKNGAFGGSTSLLFSVCGTSVLPKGVDLVVVEFALNDGMDTTDIKTPQRKAYERLLRGLLMMPNRQGGDPAGMHLLLPAIILLHFYAYLRAESNYWRSSEADHSVIGGYYGLPQLSVRAAFYREHENETTPEDTFYYDPVHPQDKTGHRYMAELLIGALRLTAQGLLREPLSQEDEQEPLPRPLNPNNYERHTQSCVLQSMLPFCQPVPIRALFLQREFEQNMVQQQGFEFINERPPKPGVTDTIDASANNTTGSWIALRVDTRTGAVIAGSAAINDSTTVKLLGMVVTEAGVDLDANSLVQPVNYLGDESFGFSAQR